MNGNDRYSELDSLRGLAATTVLLSHLSLVLSNVGIIERFTRTPLHILWAGHEAVILFFVLSGFVLSLAYLNNKASSYKDFLIRRICRIYIPYLVSVLIAFSLMMILARGGIEGLSGWFNQAWTSPITMELIINHIILLINFETEAVNGVIWSLVHEMRISIIFPLIIIFVVKLSWKKSLILALLLSSLYFILYLVFLNYLKFDVTRYQSSYSSTLHYISFFILGAVLAKYSRQLSDIYNKLTLWIKVVFLLIAVLSYTYQWTFNINITIFNIQIVKDWAVALGVSIFIIFVLNAQMIQKLLKINLINFVGKISYSLYLYHLIVLFMLFHIFYGKLSNLVLFPTVFILSFVVAALMYYLVEKPSILIGRHLTHKKKIDLTTPVGPASISESNSGS